MKGLHIDMKNTEYSTPIIIPAYEPDDRMIGLAQKISCSEIENIIIVNDGSGEDYDDIFQSVEHILSEKKCVVIKHETNKGKGRALKTAFKYVLDNIPDAVGVVTADSDGQHSVECISNVMNALEDNQDSLVLGVRQFDGEDIPWKSRFGNTLTLKVLKLVSGLDVRDTQTGLRGIPRSFMVELLDVNGERFEFEMRMLLESVGKYPIIQVPIRTIYDSKENHQTHFDPVKDSIKIYRILFEKFFKYIISSLSSFLIDIVLFSVSCRILKGTNNDTYIALSTVIARVISSIYNYIINYTFVFKSDENKAKAALKYYVLVVVQMACSAFFTTGLSRVFAGTHDTLSKIIVDTILFVISYQLQKRLVFKRIKM